jgi:hypothetical protein
MLHKKQVCHVVTDPPCQAGKADAVTTLNVNRPATENRGQQKRRDGNPRTGTDHKVGAFNEKDAYGLQECQHEFERIFKPSPLTDVRDAINLVEMREFLGLSVTGGRYKKMRTVAKDLLQFDHLHQVTAPRTHQTYFDVTLQANLFQGCWTGTRMPRSRKGLTFF